MDGRVKIVYWSGSEVDGDWDQAEFESLAAAEKAGWVVDETVNGVLLGHCRADERAAEVRLSPAA
jgi:hypothetical protein